MSEIAKMRIAATVCLMLILDEFGDRGAPLTPTGLCPEVDRCEELRMMTNQQLLERITINPTVMTGKPVIKGTRLTVEYVLNLLAHGATMKEILQEYEGLTQDDLQACLLFAAYALDNTVIAPLAEEA